MFKIVEFDDDGDGDGGELSVVREEWLTPTKKDCMWPPHKTSTKFNKCLISKTIVPDETWVKYPIKRLLYETDNLIKAREKCKKAESDSELATDTESQKRIRKRKVIYESEESEQEIESYSIKYPKPPTKLLHKTIDSPMQSSPLNSEAILPPRNDIIAQHLGCMKTEIRELKKTQSDILLRISTSSVTASDTLPVEIDLPLKSLDDLRNIENWLEEDENKENLVIFDSRAPASLLRTRISQALRPAPVASASRIRIRPRETETDNDLKKLRLEVLQATKAYDKKNYEEKLLNLHQERECMKAKRRKEEEINELKKKKLEIEINILLDIN